MRLRSPEAIEVLRRHKQWIDSNGAQGEQLDLAGADLRGALFYAANTDGADLKGVKMRKALLCGADLSGADLSRVVTDRQTRLTKAGQRNGPGLRRETVEDTKGRGR